MNAFRSFMEPEIEKGVGNVVFRMRAGEQDIVCRVSFAAIDRLEAKPCGSDAERLERVARHRDRIEPAAMAKARRLAPESRPFVLLRANDLA